MLAAFLIGTFLYMPVNIYSDSSFDVSAQDSYPHCITFSNDGTKMYIVGIANDMVHEYTLSTPYSINTSTFTASFDLGSEDNSPQGVTFSNDGAKMFITGVQNDRVYEYALPTPYSVSNSSLNSYFYTGTEDLQPSGITFSNDGTKMFIVGEEHDSVYEYALSTPYSVNTSIFTNSFDLLAQDNTPQAIIFSHDGAKMFIIGEENDNVYEYTLSTAFSVSTSTFIDSLDISTLDNSPHGLTFSNDGAKMFITGTQNGLVYEYTLPAPFDLVDIDSPTFTAQSDTTTQTTISFNEGISGTLQFSEWSFNENVPTAVSGYGNTDTLSAVTELVFTHAITSNLTPNVRYTGSTLTDSNSNVMEIATITATAPYQTTSLNLATNGLPTSVKFSTSGEKMFVVDTQNGAIYEHTLSTPFNVATSTSSTSFSISVNDNTPSGVAFSNNGTIMLVVGSTTDRIFEYTLATPFSITAPVPGTTFYVGSVDDSPSGITFSNDGTKMFIVGEEHDSVYMYTLSAPFSVTTSVLTNSFDVGSQDENPSDIIFSANGEKMFILGDQNDSVYEYALSTSFNVTTSTIANSLYLGSKDNSNQGIAFSNNGTKMFIAGSQNNLIYEYMLPAPFDLVLHPPTFIAHTDSSTQTTITFSQAISGTLKFSEWIFGEDVATGVEGFSNDATLSAVTKLVFTHPITIDQTPNVAYTGSDLTGIDSNIMDARIITADDKIPPTFTAQSDSSAQTTITFDHTVSGTLQFSEWSFDGNVPTAVVGYSNTDTLSDVTKLVFTHPITIDQTPNVAYTGTNLADSKSNTLRTHAIMASDGIIPTFTAQSDSSTQTTITFSESISGISQFSEWSFDGNVPTAVSGYSDKRAFSAVIEVIFTHNITNNQSPVVEYSGNNMRDDNLNGVSVTTAIASAPLQTTDLYVSEDELPSGIEFSTDGTKMFIIGENTDSVYEYILSVPFSVANQTSTSSFYVGTEDHTPSDITFSNNGAKMFVIGLETRTIYEYALSTPFSLTNVTLGDSLNVTTQDLRPTGVTFSDNGLILFVIGTETDTIYEYNLFAPFSLTTATLAATLNVSSQDDTPTDVIFSNNGAKMFILGNQNDRVYEYALSVPYDLAYTTLTGSLYLGQVNNSPHCVTFSNNGAKMFIVGSQNAAIHEYTLPASFDLADTTQPAITAITSDATTFGTLKVGDILTFTLTTDSFEANATINGVYNSQPLGWSINNMGAYTATYTISEGEADQITALQITNVTITDSTGITSSKADGNDIQRTIDANSPTFSSAQTISISQIAIILDQSVTDFSASPRDFTLGGVTGGSIRSIVSVLNDTITLAITGTTISDSDSVRLTYTQASGSFDDVSGNSLLNFAKDVRNNQDVTPPIITLNGSNPQTIELGAGYTELGATTNDDSPVTIDSTEFIDAINTYSIYYNSVDASGNTAAQVVRIVEVIDSTSPTSCTPPSSGDWIITENCTINSDVTVQRNVIVQNSSVLIIPSGITLDIDFVAFNLTVQSGSGVLIKSGGTIT